MFFKGMIKMKKLHAAKAAICAILVLSMLFCSGCAGKTKDLALYGTGPDGKVLSHMTPGMFSYFLSQQKSTYFTVLSFNDSSITSDSPEIWSRPAPDGGTYGEKFFEDVLNEAKTLVTANTMLYSLPSADEKKDHYELPEDYLDYVDSLIVQNAIDKYGSVMAFEDYLLNFGTTLEDYTNLYIMTANVDLLKEALFADGTGAYQISDEEKKQYYSNNYYSVRHIFVNTAYDEKMDGTRAPLSPAESAKRTEKATEIYNFILGGGTFEQAAEQFTESYVAVYKGEASMDINSSTTNAPELGDALKKMSVGEVRTVNSNYGIHIIQRTKTDPEAYDDNESVLKAIRNAIVNKLYPEIVAANEDVVTVNEDVVGNYSLATAVLP